jgi:hypothetical protein
MILRGSGHENNEFLESKPKQSMSGDDCKGAGHAAGLSDPGTARPSFADVARLGITLHPAVVWLIIKSSKGDVWSPRCCLEV